MKDKFANFKKGAKEALQSATDTAKRAAETAMTTGKNVAVTIFDQDGDGKFDQEDVRMLTEKATSASKDLLNKSCEVLNEASKSKMAKDAAAGAAVGAVVAIPVPIIGPIAGAVVGAGIGIYKNVTGKGSNETPSEKIEIKKDIDVYAEILKLGDLKEKELITEEEFNEQKKSLLEISKQQKA